jgi:hypothetical protein
MAYLLDANVFLQAKNLHYGFDFCPGFWDWLGTANARGLVYSIERVKAELVDADVAVWAAQYGDEFFLRPDAPVAAALATVSTWVTGQGYEPAAVNTFLQVADYYLVAPRQCTPRGARRSHVVAGSQRRDVRKSLSPSLVILIHESPSEIGTESYAKVTPEKKLLNYSFISSCFYWRPQGDSNPCYCRERAMSGASTRGGRTAAATRDYTARCASLVRKQWHAQFASVHGTPGNTCFDAARVRMGSSAWCRLIERERDFRYLNTSA